MNLCAPSSMEQASRQFTVAYQTSSRQKKNLQVSTWRLCLFSLLILCGGTTVFHKLEGLKCQPGRRAKWFARAKPKMCRVAVTASDSFYFMFITLATIGSTDIDPTNTYSRTWTIICVILYGGIMSSFLDIFASWYRVLIPTDSKLLQALLSLVIVLGVGTLLFVQVEGMKTWDALYFSMIISSSIGYGDLHPRSEEGKILTMLYAATTVKVLAFITSTVASELHETDILLCEAEGKADDSWMNKLANALLFWGPAGKGTEQEKYLRNTRLVIKVIVLVSMCSMMFMRLHGLSMLDAVYWTIITLSGVGYGDIVPKNNIERLFTAVMAIMGLGLFSSFTALIGTWRERLGIKNEMLSCFTTLGVIMGTGILAFMATEDLSWDDALYLSMTTATGLGHGTLHPTKTSGKIVACIYACASLSALSAVTTWIGKALQDTLCSTVVPAKPQSNKGHKQD